MQVSLAMRLVLDYKAFNSLKLIYKKTPVIIV